MQRVGSFTWALRLDWRRSYDAQSFFQHSADMGEPHGVPRMPDSYAATIGVSNHFHGYVSLERLPWPIPKFCTNWPMLFISHDSAPGLAVRCARNSLKIINSKIASGDVAVTCWPVPGTSKVIERWDGPRALSPSRANSKLSMVVFFGCRLLWSAIHHARTNTDIHPKCDAPAFFIIPTTMKNLFAAPHAIVAQSALDSLCC